MSKDKNDIHKLATGTIVNQRYEIIELLGAGGFGNTYLARDTRFSSSTQYVCIKEFFLSGIATRATNGHDIKLSDPTKADSYEEQRLRFRREAERIFSLRDEHIVRVSDLFDENGTSYYVMDYIAGQSLAQYIKEKEKLSEIEALRIVLQILYGLRVIHEINLIHLDIKPGNIMIDQHGRIMLIDFGASKIIENGSATLSAAILTTPGYAPLEQTLAELDRIGEWTDLYAVGGTFYKMLTGVTPSNAQVIIDEGRDAFSFPLEISTKSRELIFWLMNTRISERPHSTAEVITRVEHILEEFEKDSSLDKGKPVLVTPEKKTISQLSDVAKAQQKSPNIPEQQSGNVAPTPPPALNSGAPQPLFTPAPPVGAQSANKANNNIGSQVPNSNYGKPIPSAVPTASAQPVNAQPFGAQQVFKSKPQGAAPIPTATPVVPPAPQKEKANTPFIPDAPLQAGANSTAQSPLPTPPSAQKAAPSYSKSETPTPAPTSFIPPAPAGATGTNKQHAFTNTNAQYPTSESTVLASSAGSSAFANPYSHASASEDKTQFNMHQAARTPQYKPSYAAPQQRQQGKSNNLIYIIIVVAAMIVTTIIYIAFKGSSSSNVWDNYYDSENPEYNTEDTSLTSDSVSYYP